MDAQACGHATGRGLEVADIFRTYGEGYRITHRLSGQQLRVMRAIAVCRTPALGHQTAVCDRCGAQVVRYHCTSGQTDGVRRFGTPRAFLTQSLVFPGR